MVFSDLAKRGTIWRHELEGWNLQESQQVLEWQREAAKKTLLRVMGHRFGSPLPNDIVQRVQALDDAGEFDRWVEAASTAEDIRAFRKQLKLNP